MTKPWLNLMYPQHHWIYLMFYYNGSFSVFDHLTLHSESFFQEGSVHHSLKSNIFICDACTLGTTCASCFSYQVSIFFMSNHHFLMFSWSPPSLFCVAASSSHPCSKHPQCVTFAFVESALHPVISCHNIPSIF